MAQDKTAESYASTSLLHPDVGMVTRRQAAIWVPIVFFMIAISVIYAMFKIDDVKNRDTILYAKFIANLKDK